MPVQSTTVPCAYCGEPVQRKPSALARFPRHYCNRACWRAANQSPTTQCQVCGLTVPYHPSRPRQFCGQACQAIGARVRLTPPPFDSLILTMDTCWLWQGPRDGHGYGIWSPSIARREGIKPRATHRAWYLATGRIAPEGMVIGHTCDNPPCVRADDTGTYEVAGVLYERHGHLWLGTTAANLADMRAKGRERRRRLAGADHWMYNRPDLWPRGERNGRAKRTAAEVREIRALHAEGATIHGLARQYGMARSSVAAIVHYKHWRDV